MTLRRYYYIIPPFYKFKIMSNNFEGLGNPTGIGESGLLSPVELMTNKFVAKGIPTVAIPLGGTLGMVQK